MFALLINASILILAAATFNKAGKTDVAELEQVHSFLAPLSGLGDRADAVRHRAVVLRPQLDRDRDAGGQIVMEGFLDIPPAGVGAAAADSGPIAIVPAAIVTIWYGEKGTAQLLILSQVILSLQLPFADRAAGDVHRRPSQDGRARSRRSG
jgi:manganese transport protein